MALNPPAPRSRRTRDGSALGTLDYVKKSGTLTFAPGETSKTISISLMSDTVYDNSESFWVDLSVPVNAGLGSPASTMVTIQEGGCDLEMC